MNRRRFLCTPALAAAAQSGIQPAPPDSVTNPPGLEYFLLGNGLLLAGIQWTQTPDAGAQAGIVLMDPAHLNRKSGSLLWHSRTGLALTRCTIRIDGKDHTPAPGGADMDWQYPDGIPTVRIRWRAGTCLVTELLSCPAAEPALIRTVEIENSASSAVQALALATLRPNPLLFDEYEVDRRNARLNASGYHQLTLTAFPNARTLEREIEVSCGRIEPGARASASFVLTLDRPPSLTTGEAVAKARGVTAGYWSGRTSLVSGDRDLDRMFRAATHGFRAVVASSGKMDGGPWGYNLEWPRDASMAAAGSCMAGFPEIGESILQRILTTMVSEEGAALDSSFHRPPETIELDQNGQILHSLWSHWVWTGNDRLLRTHWARIRATADFPLQPMFRDPVTGLVKNSREFWERSMGYGIREGYELAYQAWNIFGWQRAAEMARHLGETASAVRWERASNLMRESFLSHPRYSFIHEGRFLKRRLANGDPHLTLEPPNREALPPGMPLRIEPVSYCDPDAASVYPMLLGIVDPAGDVARRTLESMETLWNQRWDIGGYGRYHVTGEPDSPGPWPFASLYIARAYLEAGDSGKAWRTLRWLASVPGGRSGTWFEYYGPRPIPPLPPVAIIPWTWAELVTFVIHHMLGVRPDPQGLTVRPRLLDGLNEVNAQLRLNGQMVKLSVRRGGASPSALVEGRPAEIRQGALRLPRPLRDTRIEILL